MRVLVTGSREADWDPVWAALDGYLDDDEHLVVVHGACRTGADAAAHAWAVERQAGGREVTPEPHPADWKVGKQAGHWRNQHMVNLGAELVLAFFQPGAANRGTADCVRRAEEAGIPVRRYPDAAP